MRKEVGASGKPRTSLFPSLISNHLLLLTTLAGQKGWSQNTFSAVYTVFSGLLPAMRITRSAIKLTLPAPSHYPHAPHGRRVPVIGSLGLNNKNGRLNRRSNLKATRNPPDDFFDSRT